MIAVEQTPFKHLVQSQQTITRSDDAFLLNKENWKNEYWSLRLE